ncbi:PriCT-2 domain-containing protein [Novosphingobium sp. YJ-S2-02]|uniref:PriCT-2 domain-containing protein n=1 Tax=Novosphingobium aureum TaxID=2792964 RepID=A0A931MLM1_9SPHN|nr:VapE domain-containing protein [Novosphingobium aureum]MBH0113216.1 PriCT-2 domain-containing protein [Novosphingobium aureum]
MSDNFDNRVKAAVAHLRPAGFALHWLRARDKAPVLKEWSEKPVLSVDALLASHQPRYNLGVRLGKPSQLGCGGYLHVLDLDIRLPDLAEEAWDAFETLFPDVDPDDFPMVQSGSGGESRHLYFVSPRPFYSRKLAVSEGKHKRFDKRQGRDVWSYDWEIELFGTGKQVVVPPSIHPISREPYVWLNEPDFDSFEPIPSIPGAIIDALKIAETSTYEFETREPLSFKSGQMERELDALPIDRLDDYHDWVTLGQALHHQFGGSERGFELWLEHSRRSDKFDGDMRAMKRKWRGFGKNRRKPVTMATIRAWFQEARLEQYVSDFEDLDDFQEGDKAPETPGKPASKGDFRESDDGFDDLDEPADDFDDLVTAAPTRAKAEDDDDLSAFDLTEEETAAQEKRKATLAWMSLLATTKDGDGFATNLHNVELIVRNDDRLVGLPALNEFTQETVQRSAPGAKPKKRENAAKPTRQLGGRIWEVEDPLNGSIWSSARDYAIRSILEAPQTQGGYGIKVTDRDLKAATVLAAWDNSFHPVREYLSGLEWDGEARVDTLFIDYLGVEDNAYTRSVARLLMVAGVARVYEPGCKWDYAVILEGAQGKGKSTFIRYLGKHWFSELEGDFHNGKELVEKMQGSWLLEMPELSGFNRADVRSIKAFISRQVDKVRLAYEARAMEFPRQCVLIGSTNDREYLKDDTGGRRFLPIECNVDAIDNRRLKRNVDQLWAEAYAIYTAMRAEETDGDLPLYLTDELAAAEAARLQEMRRVESADDALVGKIAAWLDRPIATGGFDDEDEGGIRNVTCLIELWEGMGNDARSYEQTKAQAFGRAMARVPGWRSTGKSHNFPAPYGRQRYYERIGSPGRLQPIGKPET